MLIHTIFDLLAWSAAALLGFVLSRSGWLAGASARPGFTEAPLYYISLCSGALAGAVLFGSVNMNLAGMWTLGHSIAGAIAGGIAGVELFKLLTGLRGSTGLPFVAPLALGIGIGRFGCFFAGLPDYTYGTPSRLPWAADFGDGIPRHPVQLYESAAMFVFLAWFLMGLRSRSSFVRRNGFYLFVIWYGAQRFLWEFLKPYPILLGPINIFHLVCAGLVAYGLAMMRMNSETAHELRPAV